MIAYYMSQCRYYSKFGLIKPHFFSANIKIIYNFIIHFTIKKDLWYNVDQVISYSGVNKTESLHSLSYLNNGFLEISH